jgi:hypothetical protein
MARKGKKNERFGIIFYVKVGNELNALVQVSLSESSFRDPESDKHALYSSPLKVDPLRGKKDFETENAALREMREESMDVLRAGSLSNVPPDEDGTIALA